MQDEIPKELPQFSEEHRMEQVLVSAPRAREALMQFHIGGCHHCGFDANDTIAKVAEDNGIPPRVLLAALNEVGAGKAVDRT